MGDVCLVYSAVTDVSECLRTPVEYYNAETANLTNMASGLLNSDSFYANVSTRSTVTKT